MRIIANRPDTGLPEEYEHKLREASESHHLPGERVLFLEVRPGDVSEFSGRLRVVGADVGGHHVLRCVSPAIPNAIAALLLYIRDETGRLPHAYFGWTEGNPDRLPAEVPGLRRRRHRAGDPRGAAAERAGSKSSAADSSGVNRS